MTDQKPCSVELSNPQECHGVIIQLKKEDTFLKGGMMSGRECSCYFLAAVSSSNAPCQQAPLHQLFTPSLTRRRSIPTIPPPRVPSYRTPHKEHVCDSESPPPPPSPTHEPATKQTVFTSTSVCMQQKIFQPSQPDTTYNS